MKFKWEFSQVEFLVCRCVTSHMQMSVLPCCVHTYQTPNHVMFTVYAQACHISTSLLNDLYSFVTLINVSLFMFRGMLDIRSTDLSSRYIGKRLLRFEATFSDKMIVDLICFVMCRKLCHAWSWSNLDCRLRIGCQIVLSGELLR